MVTFIFYKLRKKQFAILWSINIIITEAGYIVELMDLKNETQCHLFIFISHANLSSFPPFFDYSLFLSSFLSHFLYIIVLEIIFKHQDI